MRGLFNSCKDAKKRMGKAVLVLIILGELCTFCSRVTQETFLYTVTGSNQNIKVYPETGTKI